MADLISWCLRNQNMYLYTVTKTLRPTFLNVHWLCCMLLIGSSSVKFLLKLDIYTSNTFTIVNWRDSFSTNCKYCFYILLSLFYFIPWLLRGTYLFETRVRPGLGWTKFNLSQKLFVWTETKYLIVSWKVTSCWGWENDEYICPAGYEHVYISCIAMK